MKMIVAVDKNWAIGYKNKLLFHLPPDLQYFKEKTLNHTVVMGENTFHSIGKPLKGRRNIVLSEDKNFNPKGVEVVKSIPQLFSKNIDFSHTFIIGGKSVYDYFLPLCEYIYVTKIHALAPKADCYFPNLDRHGICNFGLQWLCQTQTYEWNDLFYSHWIYKAI